MQTKGKAVTIANHDQAGAPLGAVSVLDTRVHLWEDVIQGIDYVVCAHILQLVMRILRARCLFRALIMPASVLPASPGMRRRMGHRPNGMG